MIPAIAGSAFILAGIIILVLLGLVWLFWKALFVFALGAILVWAGLIVVPTLGLGKKRVLTPMGIMVTIGAAMILLSIVPGLLPFSVSGGTGQVFIGADSRTRLNVVSNEVSLGNPFSVQWSYSSGPPSARDVPVSLIFSVDGKEIFRDTQQICCYDCFFKSCDPSANHVAVIGIERFSGKAGKQVLRVESLWSGERYLVQDIEVWVDLAECAPHAGQTMRVTEEFTAGRTITVADLSRVPIAFCSDMPLQVLEFERPVASWIDGYDILQKSYLTVPPLQTYRVSYISTVPEEIGILEGCDNNQLYNLTLKKCIDPPIEYRPCTSGAWDSSLMACIVSPTDCIGGTLDIQKGECVYQVPEARQNNPICPEGSTIVADEDGIKQCIVKVYVPGQVPQGISILLAVITATALISATAVFLLVRKR